MWDKESFSEVFKKTLPLMFVELVSSLYSLTDTYFVSGLGTEAVAGLGIAMYILWLIQSLLAFFHTPLLSLVSQSIGAGKYELARAITGEVLALGLLTVSAVSALLTPLSEIIVATQSGATGATLDSATRYLRIRLMGMPIIFATMALDQVIIASGRTHYSMISNTIGLGLNIVLDPIMIYGYIFFPRMGIDGAAYATVVSNGTTLPVQILLLRKLNLAPSKPLRTGVVDKLLKLGVPALLERGVFSLGQNIYAGIVARLGPTVMAAHNIGLRIESLIYMPGFAFSMTASMLVGQSVGRGDTNRAKKLGWKVMIFGALVTGGLGFLVAATAPYIVEHFSPSREVRDLASLYLLLAGLSELGLGLSMTGSGAFRGAGNTRLPMTINVSCLILFRIIPSLVLVGVLGPLGPWLAMFIDVYARGLIIAVIFNKKFHNFVRKYV